MIGCNFFNHQEAAHINLYLNHNCGIKTNINSRNDIYIRVILKPTNITTKAVTGENCGTNHKGAAFLKLK